MPWFQSLHDGSSKEQNLLVPIEDNVIFEEANRTQKEEYFIPESDSLFSDNKEINLPNHKRDHKCRICGQIFQSQVYVRRHIMYSHLPKWTCYYCNINFNKEALYRSHIMKTHADSIHLKSKLKLNELVASHFHCVSCNFKTSEKEVFSGHFCCLFKCEICESTFKSKNELKEHESSHETNYTVNNQNHTAQIINRIRDDMTDNITPGNNINSINLNQKSCIKAVSSHRLEEVIEETTSENLNKLDKNLIHSSMFSFEKTNSFMILPALLENQEKEIEYSNHSDGEQQLLIIPNNMLNCSVSDIIDKPKINSINNLFPRLPIKYQVNMNSSLNVFQRALSQEINTDLVQNQPVKMLNISIITGNQDKVRPGMEDLSSDINSAGVNKEKNVKILVCETCSFKFSSENELKNHIKLQHTDIMLLCPLCFNNFSSVNEMHQHLQTFHGCIKIENDEKLKIDLKHKQNEVKYLNTCKQCNKVFSSIKLLKEHLKIHVDDKFTVCEVCKMKFNTEKQLENHITNIHRDLVCKFCGKEVTNLKTLKNHERRHVKNNELELQCSKCQKNFKTKEGLKCHIALHTGNFKYCCDFCGRGFMSRMAFEEHRSTHTKEERFMCDVCGKKFSSQSTYWIHRKWHDNPFPYKCNYCNRLFKHSSMLAIHKRIHTGERPYKCPHCLLSFRVSGTLKRHLILHTQQFPFNCKPCQRGFTTRHKYARHLAKTHLNCDLLKERTLPKDLKMALDKPVQVKDDTDSVTCEFIPDALLTPMSIPLSNELVSSSEISEDLESHMLQIFFEPTI